MSTEINQKITATVVEAIATDSLGKKWYTSKTVWLNLIAVVTLILQMKYGFVIDSTTQALALSVVNLALRKITKESIVF